MGSIHTLDASDVPEVVDVLCESFFDYPVMRYVVGPAEDYSERLYTLVHFFVMARVFRGETMLAIGDRGDLDGVALASLPGRSEVPPELRELRDEVWERLGDSARSRYEAFGAATGHFEVDAPHIHLNMIAVRIPRQGAGFGRMLLEGVHRLSLEDSTSSGVTLTTENPANVTLYEHFGYEVVGHAHVASELESWGFFRPE